MEEGLGAQAHTQRGLSSGKGEEFLPGKGEDRKGNSKTGRRPTACADGLGLLRRANPRARSKKHTCCSNFLIPS